MKFVVRPGLKISLMLLFILAVYFQSISHPFCHFDDFAIVEHYGISSTLSFFDVISPGTGFYFRPLVNLSFWLDNQLWGMDSSFMHLENIVAHLVNVLLVFLIASRISISSEIKVLPYLSALLFGLHPVNSESVNWIAGRTDLYAGLFVFFAVYCLIRAIQEQSTRFAMLAFGVGFVGMLAKETAIMFLPAAFLISMYWPVVPQCTRYIKWRIRFLLSPIIISSCLIISVLILVYIKGHGNNALSLIFEGSIEGSTNIFIRLLEAFGFYVKKLILPLPLNLAIVEVNPLYSIAGIITLCVLVVTHRRAGLPWFFFVFSILFMIPALMVAVTSFTWTPFGERYLYIPSAFAVIGCVECTYRFFVQRNAIQWFVPIVIVIVAISSIATFHRGMHWGDNFALLEDIVAKSPNFGVGRSEYAGLLNKKGRYAEAEKQLNIALKLDNKESTNRIIRLNLFWLEINGKPLDEARKILLSRITNKGYADIELLVHLNQIDECLLNKSSSLEDKRKIATDILETNEALFLRTGEPFHLYRSGQIMLSVDDKEKAAVYFRKACSDVRLKEYYREPARKLAEKLEAR